MITDIRRIYQCTNIGLPTKSDERPKNIDSDHTVEVTFEPIPGSDAANDSAKKQPDANKKKITVEIPDQEDNIDIIVEKDVDERQKEADDEPVIPVYDDLVINNGDSEDVSGILQDFGVTPEQAKELIRNRDQIAFDMFWRAVNEGYFSVSIDNDFADEREETVSSVSYSEENSSVHNYVPIMSACTSLSDAVAILSGNSMGYNLSISDYDIGVPEIVKTQVDEAAAQYGEQVAEYMDIFFTKYRDHEVKSITELPRDLEFEIVINIPDSIKELSDEFSVVRCHRTEDGSIENDILQDLDDDPDTITIKTGKFSSYGIVYKGIPGQIDNAGGDAANGNKPLNKPLLITILVVLIAAITASVVFPLKAMSKKNRKKR